MSTLLSGARYAHGRTDSEEIMSSGLQSSQSSVGSVHRDSSQGPPRSRNSSGSSFNIPSNDEVDINSLSRNGSFRFESQGARAAGARPRHRRYQSDPGPGFNPLYLDSLSVNLTNANADDFGPSPSQLLSPTNSFTMMPPKTTGPPRTSKGANSPGWRQQLDHAFEDEFGRPNDDGLETGLDPMRQLPPLPDPEIDPYFNSKQPPATDSGRNQNNSSLGDIPTTLKSPSSPLFKGNDGFDGFGIEVEEMSLGSSDGEGLFAGLEGGGSSNSLLGAKKSSLSNLKSQPSFTMPLKPELPLNTEQDARHTAALQPSASPLGQSHFTTSPVPLQEQVPSRGHSRTNSRNGHSRTNSRTQNGRHSRKHSRTNSASGMEFISTGRPGMPHMHMQVPNPQMFQPLQQQQMMRTGGTGGMVSLHGNSPRAPGSSPFHMNRRGSLGHSPKLPLQFRQLQGPAHGHKRGFSDPGFSFLNKAGGFNNLVNPRPKANGPGHQRKRSRGGYRCKFCGKLKKGHICDNIAAEIFTDDGNKRGVGEQYDEQITNMELP